MKRLLFVTVMTVAIGVTLLFEPGAVAAKDKGKKEHFTFELVPASDQIASCFPDAKARVTLFLRADVRGVDTLDFEAEGLPPHTDFVLFLTELPVAPFGAVQYIADYTTNGRGRGSVRVDAIIEEAFSSTVVAGVRVRKELNHVVSWFADPAGDDVCLGLGAGPTTPFDGDGEAGVAALSSRNFLPGAPIP